MRIITIQIKNYKSYVDSGVIPLGPHINTITGINNSGKTALLELLDRGLTTAHPHVADNADPLYRGSSIHFRFAVTNDEFIAHLRHHPIVQLPIADGTMKEQLRGSGTKVEHALNWMRAQSELIFTFSRTLIHGNNELTTDNPAPEGFTAVQTTTDYNAVNYDQRNAATNSIITTPKSQSLAVTFGNELLGRTYVFKAERFNIGECNITDQRTLDYNARNLPTVILNMQNNEVRRAQYIASVKEILPQLHYVSAKVVDGRAVLNVWLTNHLQGREDLTVPLHECGTGVGQVLAIVYVVLNHNPGGVVAIDEPQSFLHPGAVRKLMHFLRENKQHQYIITTHSPVVLTECAEATVLIAKQTASQTRIEVLDTSELDTVRQCLLELGARMSDVFGADRILWVEGPTEERVFRAITEATIRDANKGTVILGVLHTGDFERKPIRNVRHIVELYVKLSTANAILPPAIGFIFDREARDQKQCDDLQRESRGLISFLERRLIENYLLDSEAIEAVLNDDKALEVKVSLERVKEGLADMLGNPKYYTPLPMPDRLDEQIRDVDGAKLLKELTMVLFESKLEYSKTKHSVKLAAWLLAHKPDALSPLTNMLTAQFTQAT